MKYKYFEIWLADLSPRFGTESGKTRPVLIVQSDLLNKVHFSTIVCPITTNIVTSVSLIRVDVKKGVGGLKKDSSIMIDQVRAIDNKRFIKRIGALPKPLQKMVLENLKTILDII